MSTGISLRGNEIHINFAFRQEWVDLVKTVPDCKWDSKQRVWTVPATPWHARRTIEVMGKTSISIDRSVRFLGEKDSIDTLHSDLDLSVGDLKPYPFQAGCVEFLDRTGGRAIISDEVGLGKTIEAIAWARKNGIRQFLAVVPASVLYKWEREIGRWYPEVAEQVQVVPDSKVKITGSVIVISYDMMVRRERDLLGKFKLIILDEMHKLKNHKTKRFKSAKVLCKGVPYLLFLSGTPILNRPKELYNALSLLNGRAWNWYTYFNRYCGGKAEGYNGAHHLDELEERLRSFMIRRFKRQVMDQLPSFTRTVVPIDLPPETMRIYRNLVAEDPATIRALFPSGKGYFANELDWLSAVRQYLEKARAQSIAEWAEDFLDASENKKLVIYCGYKSTVRYLWDYLHKYGVSEITGDVSNKDRQSVIDRWQNTMSERVMLLTSAGGEGIDLFGRSGIDCSTVLFAGREWSPAVEEQIEGRLDRTGQTFPVEAVYLVARSTIDEDIHELIERKRRVIKSAVTLADVTTIVSDLVSRLEGRGITKKEVRKEK